MTGAIFRGIEALAYIDPATGGLIVGSLWSLLATILATIGALFVRYFWNAPRRRVQQIRKSPKRKRWFYGPLIGTPILLLLLLMMKLSGSANIVTDRKVLLIGIDGFDPKIVEQLMGDGKLPNFKRLKDQGSYSRLKTVIPPETPVAIGTALTGVNPGAFGVFDFISRDPKTYLPRIHLYEETQSVMGTRYASALKATPIWERLTRARIPATFIRWPLTFPPKRVSGRMLSGLGTVDIKGFMNGYRFYTSDRSALHGEGSDKVVVVERAAGVIKTRVAGPRLRPHDQAEATIPMAITVSPHSATLMVQGTQYQVAVGHWSDWIRLTFSLGPFTRVHAICKVYLVAVEPDFRMYMTSVQIDPVHPVVNISYPPGYAKELAGAIGLFYTLGMPEDTKAVTEGKIGKEVFLDQIRQIERERRNMFWYEFDRFNRGLLAFYFDASDRLQHLYWTDGGNPSGLSPVLESYYREWDQFLGEVLKRLDDRTILIIFSDHGFTSFDTAVTLNTWLAQHGYLTLTRPITSDDAGELFRYVDWGKTRAYAVGFASVYLNRKGREAHGVVAPEEEGILIDELQRTLAQLTDPRTGQQVITQVYNTAKIYHGPYVTEGPDLLVGFADGYRASWQNAVGGFTPDVMETNTKEWRGDHLVDPRHVPAILFANVRLSRANPRLIDLAPTILSLFGLEVPSALEGESLFTNTP